MATILAYVSGSATAAFSIVPGLLRLNARGHRCELVTGRAHLAAIGDSGLTVAAALESRAEPGVGAADQVGAANQAGADQQAPAADLAAHLARVQPDLLLLDGSSPEPVRRAATRAVRWATLVLRPGAMAGQPAAPSSGPAIVALHPWWRRALAGTAAGGAHAGGEASRSRPEIWTGASTWEPGGPVPSWLAEPGDPWVLVTTGGAGHPTDDVIASRVALARSAVAALRDRPVRLVITMGAAFDAAHLIPAPNVRILRFWPHRQILDHAGVVIAPSTSAVVTTSLAAGVPVVAVPFDAAGDRVARALTAEGSGVAVPLKKLRARRLRPAVGDAIGMARQVRSNAPEFADEGAPDRFADAVERLLGG